MIDSFSGEYRFLSNFYEDGLPYRTVEHRFQAAKALDPFEGLQVMDANTPGEAKRLGKRVALRPDWEDVKDGIMLDLLREKFGLPGLRNKLLATGDVELIEGNTWGDTYWGVCNGRGQNKLGKLLMRVREELRNDGF